MTVAEETPEAAIAAVRAIDADHDGVEIRVERFRSYDPAALRASTSKPLLLTRRGTAIAREEVQSALQAGIDLVDVEFGGTLGWIEEFRDRVVLSHHDFDGMPPVASLLAAMLAHRTAHVKLAVTPRSFADNLELLRHGAGGTTLIGMGERGLFARVLAPFLGSELSFVTPSLQRAAAPAQMTLRNALEIYGPARQSLRAERVFAIAGNPAGHSLSPAIHNPLFRSKGVAAAYTIASVEAFDELTPALLDGTVSGLSVTAPFKEDAFAFAKMQSAAIGENAAVCGAVNTLVNVRGRLIADNTDVDGFARILARLCGRERKTAALVGAGGTARAAVVALDRAGMRTIVYNRTEEKARAVAGTIGGTYEPLDALSRFDGEIVVNTLTRGVDMNLPLRPGMTYIEAAYGGETVTPVPGVEWIDGLELLHAQAQRQHELFMKVFDDAR